MTRRVTAASSEWPQQLDHLDAAAPRQLWIRGDRSLSLLADSPSVAIVGARNASKAGLRCARELAAGVAARGVCVVSGLALGIDAAAHEGALSTNGRTVAVLGCGIDTLAPRTNAALGERIVASGAVISEWGPGVEPAPWRFPVRNRLVAALADITIVIEASRRSGALITVDHALAIGRDVCAVPGAPWTDLGEGPLMLLKAGAIPVGSATDVLDVLGLPITDVASEPAEPTGDAGVLWRALRAEPASRDLVALRSRLDPGAAVAALTELELRGLVVEERNGTLVALGRNASQSAD